MPSSESPCWLDKESPRKITRRPFKHCICEGRAGSENSGVTILHTITMLRACGGKKNLEKKQKINRRPTGPGGLSFKRPGGRTFVDFGGNSLGQAAVSVKKQS